MSAQRFPLFLDLGGRRVLVVGGGAVATRRARELVTAGALVEVVAPAVRVELAELAHAVHERPYRPGDLAGAWLVLACTDSPTVNAAVTAEAEAGGIWCARADAATASPAWVPASARSGPVTVAVSAGGDPGLAARLRDAVRLALDTGQLPVRRTRAGGGRVALVGGGPGDPGLITVRGRRLLAEADVVLVDRLAPRALLDPLDPDVEVIDVGKQPGRHAMCQEAINGLLVDRARAGRRVVRLKGGDPFVFGRGGEELAACVAAGVPVEVVPGVTSAIGVPAVAGIPVTHRGVAQEVAVVSAHADPGDPASTVDWAALGSSRGTVVLLMAMSRLDRVAKELVAAGRDSGTPAAVVAEGTTPAQRVVTGTLDDIARLAFDAGIGSPAVVVVGEVVRLRDRLHPA